VILKEWKPTAPNKVGQEVKENKKEGRSQPASSLDRRQSQVCRRFFLKANATKGAKPCHHATRAHEFG